MRKKVKSLWRPRNLKKRVDEEAIMKVPSEPEEQQNSKSQEILSKLKEAKSIKNDVMRILKK